VIDEGGAGSQHPSGAGCFTTSRFGGLRRRNLKPASSGLNSALLRSLGSLRSSLKSASTGRRLLLQRSLRRLA
jgi:hypothetical protein